MSKVIHFPDEIVLGGPYDLIYADPPWPTAVTGGAACFSSAGAQYTEMSVRDMMEMPISEIASENCLLLMWTIRSFYPQAIDILTAWRFKYVTSVPWIKVSKKGKFMSTMGPWVRHCSEDLIIAHRAKTPRKLLPKKAENGLFISPRREHSRKPEEVYLWIERNWPEAKKAELFSRTVRDGWVMWGDQVGTFDNSADTMKTPK